MLQLSINNMDIVPLIHWPFYTFTKKKTKMIILFLKYQLLVKNEDTQYYVLLFLWLWHHSFMIIF